MVHFPLQGLELTQYVIRAEKSSENAGNNMNEEKSEEPILYDCKAVVNHSGEMM